MDMKAPGYIAPETKKQIQKATHSSVETSFPLKKTGILSIDTAPSIASNAPTVKKEQPSTDDCNTATREGITIINGMSSMDDDKRQKIWLVVPSGSACLGAQRDRPLEREEVELAGRRLFEKDRMILRKARLKGRGTGKAAGCDEGEKKEFDTQRCLKTRDKQQPINQAE
ncbi:hypothetical protein C8J56DRAFT_892008 [Mycena floridula]|nr:hypothetical protein C8J56DRAFT_892008 [Mycena floridula]